jgi:hypothetical protein
MTHASGPNGLSQAWIRARGNARGVGKELFVNFALSFLQAAHHSRNRLLLLGSAARRRAASASPPECICASDCLSGKGDRAVLAATLETSS